MRLSAFRLAAAVAALLAASAIVAYGADRPNDGRGQGNPGHVGKSGESKSGSGNKDSARDSTDKNGERGMRNNDARRD